MNLEPTSKSQILAKRFKYTTKVEIIKNYFNLHYGTSDDNFWQTFSVNINLFIRDYINYEQKVTVKNCYITKNDLIEIIFAFFDKIDFAKMASKTPLFICEFYNNKKDDMTPYQTLNIFPYISKYVILSENVLDILFQHEPEILIDKADEKIFYAVWKMIIEYGYKFVFEYDENNDIKRINRIILNDKRLLKILRESYIFFKLPYSLQTDVMNRI